MRQLLNTGILIPFFTYLINFVFGLSDVINFIIILLHLLLLLPCSSHGPPQLLPSSSTSPSPYSTSSSGLLFFIVCFHCATDCSSLYLAQCVLLHSFAHTTYLRCSAVLFSVCYDYLLALVFWLCIFLHEFFSESSPKYM